MKTIIRVLRSKPQTVVLITFLVIAVFSSCKKDDNTTMPVNVKVTYSGSFVKSKDAVVTSATGKATAVFDPTTLVLTYTITWSGLGSNAASMHFHDNGPVIDPINGFATATSGTVSGNITLTAAQVTDLEAGKIYVQIHTANYPGGEVLATLTKSSSSSSNNTGGYGY